MFFGIGDRLGTLEPKQLADWALVQDAPDQNTNNMRSVVGVMLNGVWVVRPD